MKHATENEIALYVSRDLPVARRIPVRWHVNRCADCRLRVEFYESDREGVRSLDSQMPENVDWNRLSAEMAANIHLGLEAGECVAARRKPSSGFHGWIPAVIAAGLLVMLGGAWWLNMPERDTQAIGHALLAVERPSHTLAMEDRGPVIETSASGVELRMNGSSLAVTRGASRLVEVSASAGGAGRARYVDDDTGQMTIATVYAQQ